MLCSKDSSLGKYLEVGREWCFIARELLGGSVPSIKCPACSMLALNRNTKDVVRSFVRSFVAPKERAACHGTDKHTKWADKV